MPKYNIQSAYILAGILVPATAMLGARYIGMAPSQTLANSIEFAAPTIEQFPEISLAIEAQPISSDTITPIQSPFWYEKITFNDLEVPIEQTQDPKPFNNDSALDIFVTSILPHPKNPLAIINSKPCRIGDSIGDGWKLIGIDGQTRTVTIVNQFGKRKTVSLTQNP